MVMKMRKKQNCLLWVRKLYLWKLLLHNFCTKISDTNSIFESHKGLLSIPFFRTESCVVRFLIFFLNLESLLAPLCSIFAVPVKYVHQAWPFFAMPKMKTLSIIHLRLGTTYNPFSIIFQKMVLFINVTGWWNSAGSTLCSYIQLLLHTVQAEFLMFFFLFINKLMST